jgi:hypothetical protein
MKAIYDFDFQPTTNELAEAAPAACGQDTDTGASFMLGLLMAVVFALPCWVAIGGLIVALL